MKKSMRIELSESQAVVSFYEGERLVVGALAKKDDDNPTASTLYHAATAADEQKAHIEHLKARIKELERGRRLDNRIIHDAVVAMQAATIDAQHNGAEQGMIWIENKLCGPGMLPSESDPHYHSAQDFYDHYCYDSEMARVNALDANPPARRGEA